MSSQQQPSRRLTKHPPQKLPIPSQSVSGSPPLSPGKISSFSKRHASFDSPREVPVPSPPQNNSNQAQFSYFPPMTKPEFSVLTKSRPTSLSNKITEHGFDPVFDEQADETGWTNVSKRNSVGDEKAESSTPSPQRLQKASSSSAVVTSQSHIHPYPRPYSVPHPHSDNGQSEPSSPPKYQSSPSVDRTSSASLPLPTQIPFHVLPKVGSQDGATGAIAESPTSHKTGLDSLVSDIARSSTLELDEDTESHRPLSKNSDDGTEGSGSSDSLRSVSSNASCSTSSRTSPIDGDTIRKEPTPRPVSHPPPKTSTYPESFAQQHVSLPSPADSSLAAATALRRSATISTNQSPIPPPEPPVILPSPPLPPTSLSARLASSSSNSSCSTHESSSGSGSISPNCPNNNDSTCNSSKSIPPSRLLNSVMAAEPPYAPFLSHAPPPADSWIEVETTPSEYRLNVRLPGFQRDGITLATKKRRILHVVADSWGTGGGHFERRISFGYDADLGQVRAEFDGEMLRVVVPRRLQPPLGSGAGMGYAM